MGKGPKQFRSPTIDLQKTIGIWTDFLNSQQYDSYFKDVQKFKNYVFRIRDVNEKKKTKKQKTNRNEK